jgi:type IV pilus assembly protein PilA
MKGFLKRFVAKVARGQGGFTLIEMIVVIGIIAVLAAIIVPNIGRFIGQGDSAAKEAEWDAVQTAMNAMMADAADNTMTALTSSDSIRNWTASPGGVTKDGANVFLADYLQQASTTYYYCYDGTGLIRRQDESATACPASY